MHFLFSIFWNKKDNIPCNTEKRTHNLHRQHMTKFTVAHMQQAAWKIRSIASKKPNTPILQNFTATQKFH